MLLFNCICFQEMTIPGNALPKIFSVPWDKAPPATPTTPSVMVWQAHIYQTANREYVLLVRLPESN